jgi:hypothetical protein
MSPNKTMLASMMAIALGVTALALDGGASGRDSGSDDELKFRIRDEMAPPGGMVQMKVEPYEVTPISGGRPGFSFDSGVFADVEGFDMFVTGELAGAAVVDGARVNLSYATNGALSDDYPFLTIALRIRPDVAIGAKTRFTLDPQSIWNISPTEPVVADRIVPGTVTVGGSVSIIDVLPGAGMWPAGTVVRVLGIGFTTSTRLRVDNVATGAVRLISPNEMQFTLAQATQMRGVRLRAENPDFRSTYYAYMRGITSTVSSRTLLAATEPIFSATPRAVATLGPFPSLSENQYAGLGLQNQGPGDVTIGIALYDAGGALLYQSARTLESQHRLAMELSELLDGVTPSPGSSVVVSASAPIDAIGLLCDEGSWTVSPSLPREARR